MGVALGKANEVSEAVRKGVDRAKKNLFTFPIINGTIPHEITVKKGAAKVMLKPAAPGTGVIAGGPIRALMELAGVQNVLTKSLGTDNPYNVIGAAVSALKALVSAEIVAARRGKPYTPRVKPAVAPAPETAPVEAAASSGVETRPARRPGRPRPARPPRRKPPAETKESGAAPAEATKRGAPAAETKESDVPAETTEREAPAAENIESDVPAETTEREAPAAENIESDAPPVAGDKE